MADPHPLLGDIDAIVCDLDGVIYRGRSPVEGAPEAVASLRERGIKVLFCSNNARPTLDEYLDKLADMGVPCGPDEVITSPVVAAEEISRNHAGARVLIVGGPGLHQAIGDRGLEAVAGAPADVVVVGMTPEFDYGDMDRASAAIRSGAIFYATNDDATFPAERGLQPGAGAIVASIAVASGMEPIVLGKPHAPMMEAALRRLPDGARVAMVGDRPETDLDGARAMGWKTILVLSGVTNEADAAALNPHPDVVLPRLRDLVGHQ
jgi:HAD superfamily hydrolase (TIGR01450 family)